MADVKAELQSQVTKLGDCFLNKEPAELINFYTEDCRVLPPGAPAVQGREALKAFFAVMVKFFENLAKVENSVVDVVPMGDLATSVTADTAYNADGKVISASKSVSVWKKVDGNWQIHWTAWNSDKVTPTPA